VSGASKLRRESSVNRGKSDTESISMREGEVLADLPGQLVKQDPVLLEFADDRLLFVGVAPGLQERVDRD
jgi:hypothetical protein